MGHELRTTHDDEFSGTLALGFAPDGELSFEDGVATVSERTVAEDIDNRYANIEFGGDGDDTTDASSDDELPFDPSPLTLDEFEDELVERDLSDAQLDQLRETEANGEDRAGAHDLIDSALSE